MQFRKAVTLFVAAFITVGTLGCTQEPDDGVPKACEGDAEITTPMGYWKSSGVDQKSGANMTIFLGIGTTVTEVGIECTRGVTTVSTTKLVDSEFDDTFLTIERTGVIEITRDGLNCRLEEMGGVYEISYAGSCLKIKNQKGSRFLEPNKSIL